MKLKNQRPGPKRAVEPVEKFFLLPLQNQLSRRCHTSYIDTLCSNVYLARGISTVKITGLSECFFHRSRKVLQWELKQHEARDVWAACVKRTSSLHVSSYTIFSSVKIKAVHVCMQFPIRIKCLSCFVLADLRFIILQHLFLQQVWIYCCAHFGFHEHKIQAPLSVIESPKQLTSFQWTYSR
jgi:hypothetical protein